MTQLRRVGRLTLALALASTIVAGPWGAMQAGASNGVVQVRGVLTPFSGAPCDREDPVPFATYLASGNLVGCWYIDTLEPTHFTPAGTGVAYGTETFDGCLDGDSSKCGTFTTTYKTTAKFAPDGTEEHGRCWHEITGGDGYFTGAGGLISMHDEPNGCIDYSGHIDF